MFECTLCLSLYICSFGITIIEGQGLSVGVGGILDPSAVSALAGKDNSLDIFSAAARVPI